MDGCWLFGYMMRCGQASRPKGALRVGLVEAEALPLICDETESAVGDYCELGTTTSIVLETQQLSVADVRGWGVGVDE